MGHHHVIASERPVPPTEHLDPVERIAERGEHGGDVHLVASIDKTSETLMGRHPRPDPRHRRVERSDGKNLHELSYSGGPPVSHAPHEQNVAPNTNEHTSEWFPDTCVFTVSIENAPLEPASCTIFCSWSISEPTRPLYISYAVFCLKKKKKKKNKTPTQHTLHTNNQRRCRTTYR